MSVKVASATAVTAFQHAGLGALISAAGSPLYEERIADYWSLTAQKRPYCILHPETTEDVVQVLKVLLSVPDYQFAVRSGGHVAWGASNIDNGVCIDLGVHLNKTMVDKEKGIVLIQPGARWRDVYKEIEPMGIIVAGGRTGGVGVAGLLTGGGISVSKRLEDVWEPEPKLTGTSGKSHELYSAATNS
jgi:FAD/FMN-containing dehydrogenase